MFFFPCGIQLKWEQSCKAKRIENERIVSELLLEKLIDGPIDVGGTVPETMFPHRLPWIVLSSNGISSMEQGCWYG